MLIEKKPARDSTAHFLEVDKLRQPYQKSDGKKIGICSGNVPLQRKMVDPVNLVT